MKMINLEAIKVEMQSSGSISQIEKSWYTSRPNDKSSRFQEIMKMDVPVNEFMTINFVATAPILVREVICTRRNHVVWARSSRVDDLSVWGVWQGISDEEYNTAVNLHEKMKQEMTSSHQDDFRRHLPICYMTTFSFSMSFRDLVKFLIACRNFYHPMMTEFADAILKSIQQKLELLGRWINDAVSEEYYKPFPLLPSFVNFESNTVGDFVIVSAPISLALRSQAIRHRDLVFRDEMQTLFQKGKLSSSMETEIRAQILMSLGFAEEIVRKRSCWIAQTDLWMPIISEIQKAIGQSDRLLLPCDDGKCRFKIDNDLRKQRQDPSPPCPIAAKIEGSHFSPEVGKEASDYASRRPNFSFWWKEIADVL
jgi:hypothetical protein